MMTTTETSREATRHHVLEERRRLSQSMLWNVERTFFEHQGIHAWGAGNVPSYITTNPYMARAYARVVAAFLRECQPVSRTQPLYIVELGAGSGRFAFHFLQELETIIQRSALRVPYTYVMTDFTDRNLSFWRAHPSFRDLVDKGTVDFARFDAAAPAPLTLEHSGVALRPGSVENPMVVIANYVFDSIPQDLYAVSDGRLHDVLVTITSDQPEPDLTTPDLVDHFAVRFDVAAAADAGRDPRPLAGLLGYGNLPSGTAFLLPVAALACVDYFRELSGERMLMLVADRGYDGEDGIIGQRTLGLVAHGSFSLPVNYDALGRFTRERGGTVLHTSGQHASLKVAGYLFGVPEASGRGIAEAFAQSIDEAGPDEYYGLKTVINHASADLDMEQILAVLRFSGWDANLLITFYPRLLELVDARAEGARPLVEALHHVWDHYYWLPDDDDVALSMAVLLCATGYHAEALEFLDRSVSLFGPDADSTYIKGVCYWQLGRLEAALESCDECLTLDPANDVAREMRIELQRDLDRAQ